jgi:hypothetical protein
MKEKLKDFWYYYSEEILVFFGFILIIFSVIGTIIGLAAWQSGNVMKYNCKLDQRPDLYTVIMIDGSTYAYDPDYFCNHLKEQMSKR